MRGAQDSVSSEALPLSNVLRDLSKYEPPARPERCPYLYGALYKNRNPELDETLKKGKYYSMKPDISEYDINLLMKRQREMMSMRQKGESEVAPNDIDLKFIKTTPFPRNEQSGLQLTQFMGPQVTNINRGKPCEVSSWRDPKLLGGGLGRYLLTKGFPLTKEEEENFELRQMNESASSDNFSVNNLDQCTPSNQRSKQGTPTIPSNFSEILIFDHQRQPSPISIKISNDS